MAVFKPVADAAGVALGGLASGFLVPFTTNLIVNRAAPEARARALGFMYMANYIGSFLNPWVTTPIRTALGNHQIFLAMDILLAVVALASVFVSGYTLSLYLPAEATPGYLLTAVRSAARSPQGPE